MKTDPAAHPLVQYILQPADPKGHLFDVTLDVTGLADDLRVVFHRVGSGVRVYIGNL